MSDIVERLRLNGSLRNHEAADKIEQLEAEIERLRGRIIYYEGVIKEQDEEFERLQDLLRRIGALSSVTNDLAKERKL